MSNKPGYNSTGEIEDETFIDENEKYQAEDEGINRIIEMNEHLY